MPAAWVHSVGRLLFYFPKIAQGTATFPAVGAPPTTEGLTDGGGFVCPEDPLVPPRRGIQA